MKKEKKTIEKSIEFLEKTADAKFRIRAKDLDEAFCLSAAAMVSVMYDSKKVLPKIRREIKAEGNDKLSLLYNFLEEILFIFDTEFMLICSVEKLSIKKTGSRYFLEATILGDKKSKKHEVSGGIKAITYNEMKIEENKDGVLIEAVLDI